MRRNYRICCALYGCLTTTLSDPELAFFKLPSQPARQSEWLRLMCRDDLATKTNITGYRICEKHFREQDVLPKSNRKILKQNALPSLNLPNLLQSTSESTVRIIHVLNQTAAESGSASTSQQPDLGLRDPGNSSLVFPCKACLKTITSFRYRCLVCPNYDMCGECERRGGHHDDHYVLRVAMQRPTVEVDQVESAVRRALASSTTWNKGFKSTAASKDEKEKLLTEKTRNSGDSRVDTDNDSDDTEDEPSDTVKKPEITLDESGTTKPGVVSSDDEPEMNVELVIKEEEDPLEGKSAASAFLQNIHEHQTTLGSEDVPATQLNLKMSKCVPADLIAQASQDVPSYRLVSLKQDASRSQSVVPTKGVPSSKSVLPPRGVPPSKRRRTGEHRFTTTTHSHKTTPTTKEPTGLYTDKSSSSTAATSSKSGAKVDVFVLQKMTRPADESHDLF